VTYYIVGCPAVVYFHTLYQWNDFLENFIEHKMCVSVFSVTSV